MKYSGHIAKKIRNEKRLSTKFVAGTMVTPQFINKYERGDSDIRYDTLIYMLKRMNVTMSEFASSNESSFDYWLHQTEIEIDEMINTRDSLKMKRFVETNEKNYSDSGEERYLFVSLIVKQFYNQSLHSFYTVDKSPIKNYLQKIEEWGKFEYFLLSNFRTAFDAIENFHCGLFLLKKKETYPEIDLHRYNTVIEIIMQLIFEDELDFAGQLLNAYFDYPNNRRFFILQDLIGKFFLVYTK